MTFRLQCFLSTRHDDRHRTPMLCQASKAFSCDQFHGPDIFRHSWSRGFPIYRLNLLGPSPNGISAASPCDILGLWRDHGLTGGPINIICLACIARRSRQMTTNKSGGRTAPGIMLTFSAQLTNSVFSPPWIRFIGHVRYHGPAQIQALYRQATR